MKKIHDLYLRSHHSNFMHSEKMESPGMEKRESKKMERMEKKMGTERPVSHASNKSENKNWKGRKWPSQA